jgi:hypothetical protein
MKKILLFIIVCASLNSPTYAGRGILRDLLCNTGSRGLSTMRTKLPRETLLQNSQRKRTYATVVTEGFKPNQEKPEFHFEKLPKKVIFLDEDKSLFRILDQKNESSKTTPPKVEELNDHTVHVEYDSTVSKKN